MCDTMVALGNSTQDGSVLFAKNSDRQPNEPLILIRAPRQQHPKGAKVKCTYIEIDQAEETYEALLLKPSWLWGAEMGCNEYGLNIGNEAVFTREKYSAQPRLLGMDLLRLALERCKSSEAALELLIDLLARYGQGGNCGYDKSFTYHNSFLIADRHSAWVLETAGSFWAAQRVKDVRAISNRLSIGQEFDYGHPELVRHAVKKGWCQSEADFHFARCYSDPLVTKLSCSADRLQTTQSVLEQEKGRIDSRTMKKLLRSHHPAVQGRQFSRHSLKSVCMHGGFIYGDHTTGSFIASLNDQSTYLITGSSTPCLALFKPYWLIEGENFSFSEDNALAAVAFWQRRERLHRLVLENKVPDLGAYLSERDRLEAELESLSSLPHNADPSEARVMFDPSKARVMFDPSEARVMFDPSRLREIMAYALSEEEKLLERTLSAAVNRPGKIGGSWYFRRYWRGQNAALAKPPRVYRQSG